jgi:methanogenic corrinoid protein MtbC1
VNPRYLNRTATITHTIISIKYILSALKFKEIASKILLLVKNNGATKIHSDPD